MARQTAPVTTPAAPRRPPGRRPVDLVAVLFAYVLPLALVTAGLIVTGLGVLAVALLAVEACVLLAVVLMRRRPPQAPGLGEPTRRPWLVPLVMVAIVGGVVAVAVIAAAAG